MDIQHLFPTAALYFSLMEGENKTRVLAVFDPSAEVFDNGHRYMGHQQILGWLTSDASEFTTTSTWLSGSQSENTAIAEIRLEGNFPGSPVNLRHEFTRNSSGLISSLLITA